ncbi:MAG: BolA family protein [Geminicoccaceae bacterium]
MTKDLAPLRLEVIDESAKHEGHGGWRPEGETHFRIRASASIFNEMSRLERQRHVYKLLDDLLKERVHALALELEAPVSEYPDS